MGYHGTVGTYGTYGTYDRHRLTEPTLSGHSTLGRLLGELAGKTGGYPCALSVNLLPRCQGAGDPGLLYLCGVYLEQQQSR